jgi:2-hydroxy-3-oxopropionate reductase
MSALPSRRQPFFPLQISSCSLGQAASKEAGRGREALGRNLLTRRLHVGGHAQVDAPVSGGEVGAKAATLTIMVGGPAAAFERVKPLFELMGKNITLVGANGDGQTCKIANQIIVALTIAAVGEALVFASKAGAEPMRVRQALMGGFAASRILEVNLALAGARELGVALPQTANAAQLMQACAANGAPDLDHSALVRALELLAKHEVA